MASDTFLATFGLIGLRLLRLYGVDTRRFAVQLGADISRPPAAYTRLPSRLIDRGLEKAVAVIDDPAFALRAASCWHPSHLGTLGYAWLSSGTLRTGLKRLARYSRTLGDRASSRCSDEPSGLCFAITHRRGATPCGYAVADFWLSLVLDMCRTNYGATLNPVAVRMRRPQPADAGPYHDFFACPVSFGADQDSFVLARDAVDTPLPTANQELARTFDAILATQLSELDEADLAARCKEHLLLQLTSGEPSESELATALGMSRRTLQRRLGERALSYQKLLDETRRTLALRYLDDPARTITDIAFLLGFAEQSAFSRSFRRWSGQTPSDYRRQRQGADRDGRS